MILSINFNQYFSTLIFIIIIFNILFLHLVLTRWELGCQYEQRVIGVAMSYVYCSFNIYVGDDQRHLYMSNRTYMLWIPRVTAAFVFRFKDKKTVEIVLHIQLPYRLNSVSYLLTVREYPFNIVRCPCLSDKSFIESTRRPPVVLAHTTSCF